jgi:ectoine hydroxylase-related dioxygenase (phytanoyl-CoA dioxygenase family)
MGCDPERTYLDVPRLRIATSHGYLTSGVAYAHHPHRDTWWSAPLQQVNWWMPLYDFNSESAMAFHPRYWDEGVRNDSSLFNYYDWNTNQRKSASEHVKRDTRWQPHALDPLELQPEIRLVTRVGGTLAFSGAQMHSTVPNTSGRTRYSIDFRTIDIDDVEARRSAHNVDSEPTGTSLRDFKRLSDGERVSEAIAALYDGVAETTGERVFQPA